MFFICAIYLDGLITTVLGTKLESLFQATFIDGLVAPRVRCRDSSCEDSIARLLKRALAMCSHDSGVIEGLIRWLIPRCHSKAN